MRPRDQTQVVRCGGRHLLRGEMAVFLVLNGMSDT